MYTIVRANNVNRARIIGDDLRTVVVVPTYNECENLENFVRAVYASAPSIHILIVDDNSPDGTGDLADRLAEQYMGQMFVLHRRVKAGLGRAYVAGFLHALDAGYEVILQMDADLSHDPVFIPEFLKHIAFSDVVIGSRYCTGINVVNWCFKRLLLSKFATAYVRLVTRLPVTDATGGFKCWRRTALERIDLNSAFSSGYLFQVETTFKAYREGMSIDEIPIIFYERSVGRSKMDWKVIWEAMWGVVRIRFSGVWHRCSAVRSLSEVPRVIDEAK